MHLAKSLPDIKFFQASFSYGNNQPRILYTKYAIAMISSACRPPVAIMLIFSGNVALSHFPPKNHSDTALEMLLQYPLMTSHVRPSQLFAFPLLSYVMSAIAPAKFEPGCAVANALPSGIIFSGVENVSPSSLAISAGAFSPFASRSAIS